MHEIEDFPTLDIRTLSPQQVDALVQAGIRRGMNERSRLFRSLPRRLFAWLGRLAAACRAMRPPIPMKGEGA